MLFVLFLVFQLMRMVFLAIVRAVRSNLLLDLLRFAIDVLPSKQSEGDIGMWQPIMVESDFITSFQNC